MLRGLTALAFVALLATPLSAWPASPTERLACAAHFAARAHWLTGMDKNPVTASLMQRRSDMLFESVRQLGSVDWGILRGSPSHNEALRARLAEFTHYVLIGFAKRGEARLCMDDPACVKCLQILRFL
ncbi:hypothetical protein FHY55_08415 [Oceanicola sp. D3]|uniref:hypothetical protein n=1 Tax=Oceanicola sp. D3 TaxID=2587163 RepID=UPI001123B41C|nr:hypothetical protein [Oceanicola sp. D3]QDC09262.1 hypothetical protein FHY55_08415 [Oceanicola sp. D3]